MFRGLSGSLDREMCREISREMYGRLNGRMSEVMDRDEMVGLIKE